MATTRSNLQAARIFTVDRSGNETGELSIPCIFNPYEYVVSKSNSYAEKPKNNSDVAHAEFQKAGSQTLKLKLIFDTYELGEDVAETTNQFWKLMETKTRKDEGETKRSPPDVAFEWGSFRFVSVITNMTQKFTLFTRDGIPVRAEVDVTFTQYTDVNDYPKQNPTSGGGPMERIWRVTASDRLDTIAAEVYGDATKWRQIATRNGIVDPLNLTPGRQLSIPQDRRVIGH